MYSAERYVKMASKLALDTKAIDVKLKKLGNTCPFGTGELCDKWERMYSRAWGLVDKAIERGAETTDFPYEARDYLFNGGW